MTGKLLYIRLTNGLLVGGMMLLLCNLSGCGGHLTTSQDALDSVHTLPANWSMSGRLSIVNEDENWYSSFNWVQQGNDYYIRFMGPLGQTELELRQSGSNVQLKTPSYERQSDDLEQLLFQETGWRFPLTSMRYWALGRANPAQKATVKRNEQQIVGINQSGWQIEYPRYMQVEDRYLPKKIIVTDPPVKIKIIVTAWTFGESPLASALLVRNFRLSQ